MAKNMADTQMIRRSFALILARAVKKLRPEGKLGAGSAVKNGFYYDFLFEETPSGEFLNSVEKAMEEIIDENIKLRKESLPLEDVTNIFSERGEIFKIELAQLLGRENPTIPLCWLGDFADICESPLVENTGELPKEGFCMEEISSAYFLGDETREVMARLGGVAFKDKENLSVFKKRREEIAKRDHKYLGRELELFTISEDVGRGLPMLLPKGATIRRILERFIVDEELKRGYQHVYTPILGKKDLYVKSGHWQLYQDSMYPPIRFNDEEYILRPMSCPHHFMLYNSQFHSYKDLPIRYAEIAPMYRREQSGELSGLVRVMGFHLADAHIMCRPDQLKDEFREVMDLINHLIKCLGLGEVCWFRASLRGEKSNKYVDDEEAWKKSEEVLIQLLEEQNRDFVVKRGTATFYGPKLDVQMKNVWGKEETLFTNQIDMVLAERFDMYYIDKENRKRRPIIIHRSSIGCIERTMAFLIEHYNGAFPLWLAPVQVRLLPISERQVQYSKEIYTKMRREGIRVELDERNLSTGKKVREGRLQRIPYLGIIGDKELGNNTVTVRSRDTGEQKEIDYQHIIKMVLKEDRTKSMENLSVFKHEKLN